MDDVRGRNYDESVQQEDRGCYEEAICYNKYETTHFSLVSWPVFDLSGQKPLFPSSGGLELPSRTAQLGKASLACESRGQTSHGTQSGKFCTAL